MVQDTFSSTCAHAAAENGRAECLALLAERGGADLLEVTDEEGNTCAHYASEKGHKDCLEVLVQHGMQDLFWRENADGKTCARVASENDHEECFQLLAEGWKTMFLLVFNRLGLDKRDILEKIWQKSDLRSNC